VVGGARQQLTTAGQFLDLEGRAVCVVLRPQSIDQAAGFAGVSQFGDRGQPSRRQRFLRHEQRGLQASKSDVPHSLGGRDDVAPHPEP
jgi:hypothetical protein